MYGYVNIRKPSDGYRLAIRMTHRNDSIRIMSYSGLSTEDDVDISDNADEFRLYDGQSLKGSQSTKHGYE